MIQICNQISINASGKYVFDFLADFENIPKWNYYIENVRKKTSGSIGEGTKYHQIRRNDEQKFKITSYEPVKLIEIETIGDSEPEFKRTFTFKEKSSYTRIIDNFMLDTKYPALVEKLMAGRIKTAVFENLLKLKALLETGQTKLQDGRRITLDERN